MKPWYRSRTIWANLTLFVSGLSSAVHQMMPGVEQYVDPKGYAFAFAIIGAANIWLRLITDSGIFTGNK